MTHNHIIIIGYLGRDPELRYIPSGSAVCNFSVATTEKRNNRNGDATDITTWFKIAVWGKQAESCNQYLKKGSQVYLEGQLRQEEWTDRDGNKRQNLEVNASTVRFFFSKGEGSGGEDSAPTPADKQARREALKTTEDNDIPF